MIQKVIHYCWFSGEKKNRFISNCIKSWRKTMPDYEIKCWDANSFDFDSVPFVKQAWAARNWAYVADYIRLYALYTEGGIYLDSDVKTYRRFDEFLKNRFFIGTEEEFEGTIHVEPAIMGSEKQHPFLKACLDYYGVINYLKESGERADVVPFVLTDILKNMYGYKQENLDQHLADGIRVYSQKYFGHKFGTSVGDYYAIHFYNSAWSIRNRGKFYSFCKNNDLMSFYVWLEKVVHRLLRK